MLWVHSTLTVVDFAAQTTQIWFFCWWLSCLPNKTARHMCFFAWQHISAHVHPSFVTIVHACLHDACFKDCFPFGRTWHTHESCFQHMTTLRCRCSNSCPRDSFGPLRWNVRPWRRFVAFFRSMFMEREALAAFRTFFRSMFMEREALAAWRSFFFDQCSWNVRPWREFHQCVCFPSENASCQGWSVLSSKFSNAFSEGK